MKNVAPYGQVRANYYNNFLLEEGEIVIVPEPMSDTSQSEDPSDNDTKQDVQPQNETKLVVKQEPLSDREKIPFQNGQEQTEQCGVIKKGPLLEVSQSGTPSLNDKLKQHVHVEKEKILVLKQEVLSEEEIVPAKDRQVPTNCLNNYLLKGVIDSKQKPESEDSQGEEPSADKQWCSVNGGLVGGSSLGQTPAPTAETEMKPNVSCHQVCSLPEMPESHGVVRPGHRRRDRSSDHHGEKRRLEEGSDSQSKRGHNVSTVVH